MHVLFIGVFERQEYSYTRFHSPLFLSSSVVERSAVNRLVVGSNPTWGDDFCLSARLEHLVTSNAFFSLKKTFFFY